MSRLAHWFLPETPDLLGMLDHQAALTLQGMQEFLAWAEGDDEAGLRVRHLEHEADEACRVLRAALRQAFTTPLEPEDLFSLSERLDVVLNEAKNTVREAELLGVDQDQHTAAMARALLSSTEHVVAGLALLGRRRQPPGADDGAEAYGNGGSEGNRGGNHNGSHNGMGRILRAMRASQASSAPDAADRAIKAERAVEHSYRRAMSELPRAPMVQEASGQGDDLAAVMAVMARQEVYRRFAGVGEALVKVADRIWYATVKNE